MEFSLQSAHPDILTRIALHLPLSSRLQLAATCRSLKSRVIFKHGNSQLENLPSSVLYKITRCLSSHGDRLRIGATSWTLRKWTIQNGLLTLHCQTIFLLDDHFVLHVKYGRDTRILSFRDGELPIRVAAREFAMPTDFSREHIDQSIRRLSAFLPPLRPPFRPESIRLRSICNSDSRSDDPTAVRRLIECLGGTSRPIKWLSCNVNDGGTLLLESDFLHRVQVRNVNLVVGDIGPDGLDFAVEDSVQEGAQLREYPSVFIELPRRESSTSSVPIVFNSVLRFMRAHCSPSSSARFKYDVALQYCSDVGSAVIRTLADECGVQLETCSDKYNERLRFTTPSDPTRRIVSVQWLNTARHGIFVGAGQGLWWLKM